MQECHVHTTFSHDGKSTAKEHIKRAIELGLSHIAITDHCEGDLKSDGLCLKDVYNAKAYCDELMPLKEEYSDKIYVSIGIECGFDTTKSHLFKEILKEKRIEYVINSIHLVNGSDPYNKSHFDGKSKEDAFNEFLLAVEQSLDAPYRYNAIGHLTYISRTAPYPDPLLKYVDFKKPLDRILKKIIERELILELNTGVYNIDALALPDYDIIEAYFKLGGRNITISSDAHHINRLCDHYKALIPALQQIGFKNLTVIQNHKKINLPF